PCAPVVDCRVAAWAVAGGAPLSVVPPSVLFGAEVYPLVPSLRASAGTAAFLDRANAAAVGLMAAVAWQLGTTSIVDGFTSGLGLTAAVLLIRFRVNSAWLVLGGGLTGLLATGLGRLTVPGVRWSWARRGSA